MMELPTPPTDNLYKFMAIAGLLVFAASIYFPFQFAFRIHDEVMQCEESLAVLQADVDYTIEKKREIDSIIHNTILRQQGLDSNSPSIFITTYSMDEIKQMKNMTSELNHQNALNLAKIESCINRLKSYQWQYGFLALAQALLLMYSLRITKKGFNLWYSRIQKYIDLEMRGKNANRKKL